MIFVLETTPLHRLRRLNAFGYDGPPVFWHEQLKRAGADYRKISCPQAEWRSLHSFEMGFNWTEDNPGAMADLGAAIVEAVMG